jgi:hypothetical protein
MLLFPQGNHLREHVMENLIIEATRSTPLVHFEADKRILTIHGESYPENAAKFYQPIYDWISRYFNTMADDSSSITTVNLEIIYFNSSSSKALMNLFDLFEDAGMDGKKILINWRYHEENDTAMECGEEFKEEMTNVEFNLIEIAED